MKPKRNLVPKAAYVARTTDLCFDTAVHENDRINCMYPFAAILYSGVVKGQKRWYNEIYIHVNQHEWYQDHDKNPLTRYDWNEKGREKMLNIRRIK